MTVAVAERAKLEGRPPASVYAFIRRQLDKDVVKKEGPPLQRGAVHPPGLHLFATELTDRQLCKNWPGAKIKQELEKNKGKLGDDAKMRSAAKKLPEGVRFAVPHGFAQPTNYIAFIKAPGGLCT